MPTSPLPTQHSFVSVTAPFVALFANSGTGLSDGPIPAACQKKTKITEPYIITILLLFILHLKTWKVSPGLQLDPVILYSSTVYSL